MRFGVSSDANSETRVGEATRAFSAIAEFWFKDKNYGSALGGVFIVATCRDPDLILKQRINLHKEENDTWLGIDLMLDYNEIVKRRHREPYSGMVSAALLHRTDAERGQLIRKRIVEEVPVVLRKYVTRKKNPLKDFDVDRFERDLRKCLLEGGLEEVTPEYNRHAETELGGHTPPRDWRS